MWYSIKSIKKPSTIKEAFSLKGQEGHALFSGGTYLVADKNPSIHSLVDITGLVGHAVVVENGNISIKAGATLQTFIDTVKSTDPDSLLLEGAKASCPSKNIRNQRTFGGEVGRNRPNSEVLVFLHAADAVLTLYSDSEKQVPIRDWDGEGIVTEINYYPNRYESLELQRFSVLESAPAAVIVGGIRRDSQLEFSIGGNAKIIRTFKVNQNVWTKDSGKTMAQEAVGEFLEDHLGSFEFKESLIAAAVNRVGEAL